MGNILFVKDVSSRALSDQDGLKLRDKITEKLKGNEVVIIDFTDINYFATPFFNISIGFLVMNLSPDVYQKKIMIQNITEVGKKTYERAVDNAQQKYYMNKTSIDTISSIIHNENKFN